MLNEEKVKVMNKLAMYETREGKKYLPVSKFYRSDYIGQAMIKNFFLVTIGYVLILAAVAAYFGDYLLENIHKMDLVSLGTNVVVGYAVVLGAYSLLTYIQYSVKYHRAKKSVRNYYIDLTKLSKIYGREEKKMTGRGISGGYK
jgi:predicted Co/Zn/Cd cation transporter (cation efflux family)